MKTRTTTGLARAAVSLALLALAALPSPVWAQDVSGTGEAPGALTSSPPPVVVSSAPGTVASTGEAVLGESVRRAPPSVCVETSAMGGSAAPATESGAASATGSGTAAGSAGSGSMAGSAAGSSTAAASAGSASSSVCGNEAVLGTSARRAIEAVRLPKTGGAGPLAGLLAALCGLGLAGLGQRLWSRP